MGHLMKAALAAGVLAVGLTGCSHAATLDRPVKAPATTGATSASAHSIDPAVQRLWDQTLVTCPAAASPSTLTRQDAPAVVVQNWVTDDQVGRVLAGLRPSGTEKFTEAHLLLLRVALQDTRRDLRFDAENPTVPADRVNRVVKAWTDATDFLVREINTGADQEPPNANTAYVMDQVYELRESTCKV